MRPDLGRREKIVDDLISAVEGTIGLVVDPIIKSTVELLIRSTIDQTTWGHAYNSIMAAFGEEM